MTAAAQMPGRGQDIAFEAMHLQVGGRLQFITHRGMKPVQHFSALIGYVKDDYLIVKMPMDNGSPIPLAEGEKLTIRVFSGVNVCSFACSVQRIFPRPLNYVHLTFPDTIQGTSLRAAMRVKVDIPAQISGGHSGAPPANVFLVNLSVTGALIESGRKLPLDDEFVNLQFTLIAPPGDRQVIVTTQARIRNVSQLKSERDQLDVFTYGLQFVDLAPEFFSLVQNLTYEAMIADRHKIV